MANASGILHIPLAVVAAEVSMPSALIVEDSESSRELFSEWLKPLGFGTIATEGTLAGAQALLKEQSFDLVLLDLQLPDGSGLDLLKQLEDHPDSEIVVITGHGTIDSAIDAMRGGAIDYLTKPVDLRRLQKIVTKSVRSLALRSEVASLRGELRRMGRFGGMVGASEAMQRAYDLIIRVAPTSSTVLIVGETGTGKELIAETIHKQSRRAAEPFIAINCGAVSATLIESELFGHERGSFTGAERKHKGIFERANGGTLFLDEITEMPMELQVRLLRILETSTLTRVGGDEAISADARVLAATNRDPGKAVQEGKLREDLLYRLNVFPIVVPPLRDRAGDITLLALHFLERLNKEAGTAKTFTPAALERLERHTWPGNVRELKNAIERAHIIAGDRIDAESLPLKGAALTATDAAGALPVGSSIAKVEEQLILATMDRCRGDKRRAAEILGISLKTLYNKLGTYDGTKNPRAASTPAPGAEESAASD
jgi:two-component system response regulator AtoC